MIDIGYNNVSILRQMDFNGTQQLRLTQWYNFSQKQLALLNLVLLPICNMF